MTMIERLVYGELAAQALLLVSICLQRKILRRYPWLTAWCAFSAARTVTLMGYAHSSTMAKNYAFGWLLTEPIQIWFYLVLALEWHHQVASHYPGNERYARLLFRWGFGVATLVAAVPVAIILSDRLQVLMGYPGAPLWYRVGREVLIGAKTWVTLGVTLFLASDRLYWKRLHRPVPKNRWRHNACLILYAATAALSSAWAALLTGYALGIARSTAPAVGILACLWWTYMLRSPGEIQPPARRTPPGERDAARAAMEQAMRALRG